jgi:glycolate oxidase
MSFEKNIRGECVRILGAEWVKDDPVTLYTYRCDGLTLYTAPPMGVLFPGTVQELVSVVKLLHQHKISFIARGAGTGLSGGAIPQDGSVIIEMARFKEVHEVDMINRTITVGPGVINLRITEHVNGDGYHYAPDPSSQKACTIGGNVAENSGGPHTLKYGVTVNHVLGVEMVLADGELVTLGANHFGLPGPDLLGLITGSEGTFGIISKIICRLTPNPEKAVTMLGIYKSVRDACESVSSIIGHGIIPAALEMLDRIMISAVEKALKPGFPLDAEAVLIVELDGLSDGLDVEAEVVEKLLKETGAITVNRARDEVERAKIWRARKEAFGAIGQISPSYYVQDGVIPRSKLPEVLDEISAIGKKHGLTVANVFHAGDGNLHPLILYDYENPQEVEKAHAIGEEILSSCIRHGGTLSGEHGIGIEKAEWMSELYSGNSLDNMQNVRAFFNPENLLNPGKIFPQPGRCAESKSGTPPQQAAALNKPKMVASKSGIAV